MLQAFMQIPMRYTCHCFHRTLQPPLFSTQQVEALESLDLEKEDFHTFHWLPLLPSLGIFWQFVLDPLWCHKIIFCVHLLVCLLEPPSTFSLVLPLPIYHLATKPYGFFPLLLKALRVSAFPFFFYESFLNLLPSLFFCSTWWIYTPQILIGWGRKEGTQQLLIPQPDL